MKFTLFLVSMTLLWLNSYAQTSMKTPKHQKLLIAAYVTTGMAVTFHGLHEIKMRDEKKKSYFDGAGNGALFLTAALLVTAGNEYGKWKRERSVVSLSVTPTSFSLSYRF